MLFRKIGALRSWVWILAAIILALFLSINIVPAGRVGVIARWGAVNRTVYPGMSIKIPIAEAIYLMDVRTQKDQVDTAAASKDLQVVTATIAINYHLDGKFATDVYQNVGIQYQDILIAPAIQNIFKATTAQYTAEELITKRDEVRLKAERALADQLINYHVVVENFNIVNFDFSPEFNAAIEAKQVAQQQVETAKQLLAKAQIEAQTALAIAQGEANAQAALKNSGALTPEYLQYLFLTTWDGHLPSVMTSGTGLYVGIDSLIPPTQPAPTP